MEKGKWRPGTGRAEDAVREALKSCFVDGGSFLCIFQDKDRAKA
jgi:hypothetical protein